MPALFSSIEAGEHVDNRVMVLGYVVMRLAMVFQWLRAARQSPQHRHACLTYAKAIADGLVAHHRDEGREHEREQADRHRDARPGQEHEH